MKIVIDIPESTYRNIKYGNFHLTERDADNVINAIKNADDEIISETSMHHLICAFCDNDKCVRGTKKCEFEQWKAKESEKTLAEIITKYDFMVGSKELKEELHKILPKEANIVYSPFIENDTTILAIKKFDIMDLLQEPYKEDKE